MEPKGVFTCSHVSDTDPEYDEANPHPKSYLPKIYFNIFNDKSVHNPDFFIYHVGAENMI
jgi:hypothetical protein